MQLFGLASKAVLYLLSSKIWGENDIFKGTLEISTSPGVSPGFDVGIGGNVEQNELDRSRRPVVIWHGLGDDYNSSSLHEVQSLIDQVYPGIFIYRVRLDDDAMVDQRKSMFGNANEEVGVVCEQLGKIKELEAGFDAVGFSQGGLFLRALIQRCPAISVNNLITFGSPHMGVQDLPLCKNPRDWVCKRRNEILKKQVWFDTIQESVIPAQYFRDTKQYDNYVAHSHFLADVNNELVDNFNSSYVDRMLNLNKFLMVVFTQDSTLVPKESAAFGELDEQGNLVSFTDTIIYRKDLLGLKKLHEYGKIEFSSIDDNHMAIPDTFLVDVAQNYLGELL